mmetsp:Transcript_33867/g.95317  ORF Transcript_33867/g.95317 Transcript_33867/m.95317 type:complete len:511 (-) Transcript_33867:101-1633(-)|eukprot:CAMPEP_0119137978 /NCGR_PEP_ID=MMETSP1310-20130426/24797_1 /TAXON_ID=464262 /ORGANISM="Genus nov. species nov., Strain RCC2339" /LENGTH=510 /DNA_ID=CAMNT_0007129123 /DNA_START=47 /DNA_END=1579 /DNA_ORIENTATION=-
MGRITVYVSSQSGDRAVLKCGHWAKQVLDGHKVPYMEVDVSMMVDQLDNMYKLSLGLNKTLPQIYLNKKCIAFGDRTIETLDKLQEGGKFKKMLEDCLAAPDPDNPPFVGIWHPNKKGKSDTVLVWDPDEEVEYETGTSEYESDEEDGSDVEVVYEYVDEDGNTVEMTEEEIRKMEEEDKKEKEKKEKDKKKKKKAKEGKKKRGIKKTGAKKGGKLTKQYDDDFLNEKRNKKKKKSRTKTVQLSEFSEACKKTYVDQAKFFLNAFWEHVEADAEKIWDWTHAFIAVDSKGKEGNELDEVHMSRFLEKFEEALTAIARRELFEDTDITENKHVSLLEYCITKYKSIIKTEDGQELNVDAFVNQLMDVPEIVSPELKKAQQALDAVMKIIHALEAKKADLKQRSELPGIKGKMATNELAQLLAEDPTDLNRALLTAEAALRRARKKFGGKAAASAPKAETTEVQEGEGSERATLNLPTTTGNTAGTMWWLERELAEAKKYKPSGEVTVNFIA